MLADVDDHLQAEEERLLEDQEGSQKDRGPEDGAVGAEIVAGNSSVLWGDKELVDFKGSLLPTSIEEEEKPQKDHIDDDREQEPQRSD